MCATASTLPRPPWTFSSSSSSSSPVPSFSPPISHTSSIRYPSSFPPSLSPTSFPSSSFLPSPSPPPTSAAAPDPAAVSAPDARASRRPWSSICRFTASAPPPHLMPPPKLTACPGRAAPRPTPITSVSAPNSVRWLPLTAAPSCSSGRPAAAPSLNLRHPVPKRENAIRGSFLACSCYGSVTTLLCDV